LLQRRTHLNHRSFSIALQYCKNYWVALDLVKRETGSNERLQEFLSYCAVKPETRRQDLGSFLIKPVQRICKYPLFFRDLLCVVCSRF
jgi:hypothetical protein